MSAQRDIPQGVIDSQRRASDPGISAWVSANAGSGKTHVLTQRVISLLLRGEDPAKILCITFTKAAAANMSARIFRDLAEWITLDDATLGQRLAAITTERGVAALARARRLFALALETPGGLKVQTIHAFCTRLLHQFPFEADVAARFSVLDEASEHQLLNQLTLDVMLEGATQRDSALGHALEAAIGFAADQTLHEVIREVIRKRDIVQDWVAATGAVPAAIARLSDALGVNATDSVATIEEKMLSDSLFSDADCKVAAALLAQGGKSDAAVADILANLARLTPADRRAAWLNVFLTDKLTPRKRLATNAIANANPALVEKLFAEQTRLCALLAIKNAMICRDKSAALLTLAHEIVRRYRIEKDRRGLLDYEDLIDKTLALFRKTSAAWVLFKLDLGINHVLIDEAQDTSPKQWEIIRTLTSEFTTSAGARPVKRTLFAVGDDKQSIFSFQGADPNIFARMAKDFETDFRNAGLDFEPVPLRTSFRSGPAILGAVDEVFKRPQAHRGLTADPVGTVHEWLTDASPGCVDIWPLTRPDPIEKPEGWDAPFDNQNETRPQIQLARRIARNVELWTRNGTRPGDVLVLVRQRGSLFEAVIRALKAASIPVAGADRLVLTEHIAVMDLIALADALLLPENDLALATVLKSPFFGLSEDDLFALAWDRGAASLRASLLAKATGNDTFAKAARAIETLTDAAHRLSPFAFYAHVLGAGGGRRKFLARLGPEASDALDEFLNLTLDYESRETASLQGFVSWLRAAEADVKRDMEQGRNEVRVMTVHGAKGLEAKVVILADTTTRPSGHHSPKLIPVTLNDTDMLVWAGNKTNDPDAVAQARADVIAAEEDEYRRLLYVAMTRAEQRLVVCGVAHKATKDDDAPKPEGCWYHLIEAALVTGGGEAQSHAIDADDGEGQIWRYLKSRPLPPRATENEAAAGSAALPDWLLRPAVTEEPSPKPLSPSDAWDEQGTLATPSGGDGRKKAMRRGRMVHRLMQSLPGVAPSLRRDTAVRYLERANTRGTGDGQFSETELAGIAAEVTSILEHADFTPLFAPGSRAEVPIVGHLPRPGLPPRPVAGQVDRLIVTAEAVLIADYKTNHAPPASLERALTDYPDYVLQLALYRFLLGRIYPQRSVRAAIVWTETPALMELPGHALDAALRRLTSA
jgi:ATP-dependent helicase/nuclease subunit A